jgi:hypothetical protein
VPERLEQMSFQDESREGSDAHTDALRRLNEARGHQYEMEDALGASKGAPSEPAAAEKLSAACETSAAREAWVAWIERGY